MNQASEKLSARENRPFQNNFASIDHKGLHRVMVAKKIYVSGPEHGGAAVVGNTYLEGTYSEIYPNISQDEARLRKLFIQFSFPGGIPSHASPECPGSIHVGGELGSYRPPLAVSNAWC